MVSRTCSLIIIGIQNCDWEAVQFTANKQAAGRD